MNFQSFIDIIFNSFQKIFALIPLVYNRLMNNNIFLLTLFVILIIIIIDYFGEIISIIKSIFSIKNKKEKNKNIE